MADASNASSALCKHCISRVVTNVICNDCAKLVSNVIIVNNSTIKCINSGVQNNIEGYVILMDA